mgnify:CR=1 FL=1
MKTAAALVSTLFLFAAPSCMDGELYDDDLELRAGKGKKGKGKKGKKKGKGKKKHKKKHGSSIVLPDGAFEIDAEAGFSCDFSLSDDVPLEFVPAAIERDRMYMADQPGMLYGKHLPFSIDFGSGLVHSGGRYLFESDATAKDYETFVTQDFVLDGFQFLERPGVIDPSCVRWSNIGSFELGDIESDHIVMRTERWSVPGKKNWRKFLVAQLPSLVEQAVAQGYTGLWVLYNPKERLVELVTTADRLGEADPTELDFPSLFALAFAPDMGEPTFSNLGWTKVLDRAHFVFSIWFPFELGDQGAPSLWPNSPPLPQPFCGDGVCSVSRGEDFDSCAADCPVDCGDGVCQPGEDTMNCPGDCRL